MLWDLLTEPSHDMKYIHRYKDSRWDERDRKREFYHSAHVITHSSKVERKHPEEVKKLSKSVHISAENLLSISSSNLTLKESNLVQANISSFTNL